MKKKFSVVLVSILLVFSMLFSLSGCGEISTPSTAGTSEVGNSSKNDPPKTEDPPKVNDKDEITAINLMAGIESTLTDEAKELDEEFIHNQMNLALKLFKATSNEKNGENVLVSPLSIQLALAMNANGADGITKAEMEALLGGDLSIEELNEYLQSYVSALPSEEKSKLEIANSIWFRNSGFVPNPELLQTNKNYYDADVYSAPFDKTTVNDMNNWVNEKTDGMIKKAINDISPDAIMYLINAVMFDAEWQSKYDEHSIYDGKFNSVSGAEEDVEMMSSNEYIYIELDNAMGFKKNYAGAKYSFVALLPNEDIDINDFVGSLEAETLAAALQNQRYENIIAKTPKFSYEFEIKLNDALAMLGMESAFDSGKADFSGLGSANGNIFISSVVHKTYISVNEAGTRAGAVTVVEDSAESEGPEDIIYITLDRPFLYMIVDNATNLPIFIGTLTSVQN